MICETKELKLSKNNSKVIVLIPAFNEQDKTCKIVRKIPKDLVDEVVVIDDGSTDSTSRQAKDAGATILTHNSRRGMGVSIRTGIDYALKNEFNIIVVMAGNGKDDPRQISLFLNPLIRDECDYIQGSRYIKGGYYGKMPLHRFLFTKMYSFAVWVLTGCRITDGTNGFRAYKASILKDKRINLYQDWLDESLEYYLSIKVIKLGYRIKEVPVAKVYPQNVPYEQYTKIKPFKGWLKRLAPLFFLTTGIKK